MALRPESGQGYALGRLSARVSSRSTDLREEPPSRARGGVRPLGLGGARDGVLLEPNTGTSPRTRLLVALHGAGGSGRQMIDLVAPVVAGRDLIVLAPDSRSTTWDVIRGGYGPDVAFIDDAIATAVGDYDVRAPLVVCGFSDGASYALSLGIANGDLIDHVIAWSPGFAAPATSVGRPRIFISHGVADRVLSIDRCSRRLVPVLRDDGYDVTYEEFDDGHRVPATVVERALDWAVS
jgi:phospholipase/carboxylesterase